MSVRLDGLDQWLSQGFKPGVMLGGTTMFPGFANARALGWPIGEHPRIYLPEQRLD